MARLTGKARQTVLQRELNAPEQEALAEVLRGFLSELRMK